MVGRMSDLIGVKPVYSVREGHTLPLFTLECNDFIAFANQIIEILLRSPLVVSFLHAVEVHELASCDKLAFGQGKDFCQFL